MEGILQIAAEVAAAICRSIKQHESMIGDQMTV